MDANGYSFTIDQLRDGAARLIWTKDGKSDPLSFWVVATSEVGEAKRLVMAGEVETQDGSTIQETVKLCARWWASPPQESPPVAQS